MHILLISEIVGLFTQSGDQGEHFQRVAEAAMGGGPAALCRWVV